MTSSASDGDTRKRYAAHLLVLLSFVGVVAGFWAVTDYRVLFCEDIGYEYIPKIRYAYRHPWDAYRGVPTPEYVYGSVSSGLEGAISMPAVFPVVPAVLHRIAPDDLRGLARFEWTLTGFYLLAAMIAIYWLQLRLGLGIAIAAGVAIYFPFCGPIFAEWRHVAPLRGRLLVPIVMAALHALQQRPTWRTGLAAGGALVLVLAHSFQLYWVLPLAALWIVAGWLVERPPRTAVLAYVVCAAVVGVFFVPAWRAGSTDFAASASADLLARDASNFFDYLYMGASPSDGLLFTYFDVHSLLRPLDVASGAGPIVTAGLVLALGALFVRGPRSSLRNLAVIGALCIAIGLLLAKVSYLPRELLFTVRDDRPYLRGLGIPAPPLVALLFHCTRRTWMMVAFVGELLVAWSALARFAEAGSMDRRRQLACGFVAYLAVFAATLPFAAERGSALWSIGVVVTALCALSLTIAERAHLRVVGAIAIVALVAGGALRVRRESFALSVAYNDHGRDWLETLEAMERRIPATAQHDRTYRLAEAVLPVERDIGFVIESASDNSYPCKHIPKTLTDFLAAAGGVRTLSHLPHAMWYAYDRLAATGLTDLLGLRHFIARADHGKKPTLAFLPKTNEIALHDSELGAFYYYENKDAFPRVWGTSRCAPAATFADAVGRVVALGTAHELRNTVVLDEASCPATLREERAPTVARIARIDPGLIEVDTDGEAGFVTTNEPAHPAWRVEIDGQAAPVLRANAAFLGASIAAGRHHVRFVR